MNEREILLQALEEAAATLAAFLGDGAHLDAVASLSEQAIQVLQQGGRIYLCGNGGSMSDAMHFAEELSGRFRAHRAPLPALAFSDPATLSCIANDYGYEEVFARQIEAHGQPGDLFLLLSTSGESPNLLAAAARSRAVGIFTAALLGRGGGKLAAEVDLPIVVPRAQTSDRIQEVHLQVLHAVLECIERRLFPENYGPESTVSPGRTGPKA